MTTNWIIALPRADINHCLKVGMFGLSRKNVINRVRSGDKILCLATGGGNWSFVASGHATSDYFLDVEPIFLRADIFPDRFKLQATKFRSEIPFAKVVSRLALIKRPEYYAVYFRNGIAEITEQDWDCIMDSVG
jgi:hypothetical protein